MKIVDAHTHAHLVAGGGSWPDALVCCGTQPDDWPVVSAWCGQQMGRIAAYGVHPWFADLFTDAVAAELEQRLAVEPGAGIGEIGLDYFRPQPSRQKQQEAFTAQLHLGLSLARCVSIHCVRAWGDLIGILAGADRAGGRILVHDFRGSVEVARELVAQGVYLSLHPRPDDARMRDMVRGLPATSLLIESDAGGGTCNSAYSRAALLESLGLLACWRAENPENLAAQLHTNSRRFLGADVTEIYGVHY